MKHRFSLLAILALILASCSTQAPHAATASEIQAAAKRIVEKRDKGPETLFCHDVSQDKDDGVWRVRIDRVDPQYLTSGHVLFLPGKGRELLFDRSGKLISFVPLR